MEFLMKNKPFISYPISNRRTFLKNVIVGTTGLTLSSMRFSGYSPSTTDNAIADTLAADAPKMRKVTHSGLSNVSLYSSSDQREASFNALKPLQSEIEDSIGDKQIVLKINLTQTKPENLKGATDVNFTRGILDFLKLFYDRQIIIGESCPNPMEGFANYGYLPLKQEYNVKLLNLNGVGVTKMWIQDAKYNPLGINIINTYLDPDVYMISPTRFKTHDRVIATLSFKNIAMGSPIGSYPNSGRGEKNNMHQGINGGGKNCSYNMFRLATYGVRPDLAVLDGIRGMEGNGPNRGDVKEGKIALASTDWVAADRMGIELMGIDYNQIKYLQFCSAAGMGTDDISKMNLMGEDYHNHISSFALHNNIDQQREWLHEDFGI
jgi:uncharacterized protein (DUF362 family)